MGSGKPAEFPTDVQEVLAWFAHGHRGLSSGDSTQIIPQLMFIENGTDPGKFGEVCVLLPGRGHWVQQERLAEVNAEMIDFLRCERRR